MRIRVALVADSWVFGEVGTTPLHGSATGSARSARPQGAPVTAVVEFRDAGGKLLLNAAVPAGATDTSRAGLVLKGILEALSIAKGLGGRRITIAADDYEAVCMASKKIDAPHELIPTYLQVRALMHQYQSVKFVWTPSLDEFFTKTAADGCFEGPSTASAADRASA